MNEDCPWEVFFSSKHRRVLLNNRHKPNLAVVARNSADHLIEPRLAWGKTGVKVFPPVDVPHNFVSIQVNYPKGDQFIFIKTQLP